MDLSNRSAQPQGAGQPAPVPGGARRKPNKVDNSKLQRIAVVVGVALVTILLVATIIAALKPGNSSAEAKLVDESKLQAVFLNTGQVYFGKVTELNSKYFVVTNIYYLQTSGGGQNGTTQANSNTSVSLVKLGCELHEPLDKMVINRDQVTFWENLGDNGQVATAVKTFVKQNPNGQKCADQSSSSSTTDATSTQPANNGSTNGVKTTP